MSDVRQEMDQVINELESKGINLDVTQEDFQTRGLGDVVEGVLTKFGVTQERYKEWFGLQECNCTKRKKYLNSLFSWSVKK
jgi:hypothetical protein